MIAVLTALDLASIKPSLGKLHIIERKLAATLIESNEGLALCSSLY
jgi:hypothetical protein